MKVWLIQRSEPTPHDNGGVQRAMRMGILAQMLARSGHQVVWWTSTFDHYNRRHRHEMDMRLSVETGYEIQYLRGCGYNRNMSLARIRDNVLVARRFTAIAEKDPDRPDVILASIPTIELALAATNYANKRNIPVLLDIRDLWPDVFFDLMPTVLSPIVRLLSIPMKRNLERVCKAATGIIGLTDAFVDWGVAYAGRERTDTDRVFPMGYLADDIPTTRIEEGMRFWRELGVYREPDQLIVAFFGVLGRTNDLAPVVQAAKLLESRHVPSKIIICGTGENASEIRKQAQGVNNLLFPGWVTAEQIGALLRIADIGVAPYIESANYINNIPNKPAEYLSGGLAIALSLSKGVLYDLLVQRGCGFSYENQPEKLADELEFMASNPSHLKTLQANALTTFHDLFDGDAVYTRLIGYLEEIASVELNAFSGS